MNTIQSSSRPPTSVSNLPYPLSRRRRVRQEMRALGASHSAIHSAEGKYLPHIIHDGEHIGGIVYGWLNGNFSVLVATDRRVFYLDKKPFFVDEDEINYNVVSGVDYSTAGIGATVTLHTRVKDYVMYTLNDSSARKFVKYIEDHCLEQPTF